MKTYYQDATVTLYHGKALDVLKSLPDKSVDCVVTSPPYFGLRSYLPADHPDKAAEIGAEPSPAEYVAALVAVMTEAKRVLAGDGTLWLNLGDSYSTRKVQRDSSHQPGMHADRTDHETIGKSWVQNRASGAVRMPSDTDRSEKNLLMIPARVAIALQDDGWILRNDIIWAKPNGMPESVTDRLATKHEHLFLFAKKPRYWFDLDPIREAVKYSAGSPQLDWARESKEADVPGQSMRQHRTSRPGKAGGTNLRPTGRQHLTPERAQKRRAQELFDAAGLTEAHLAAMRAVGMSDAGKALATQGGAGKNAAETQRLADEAKAALGGYYREFLYDGGRNPGDWWVIPTQPFAEAHFAVFPIEIPRRCIAAGCKPGGVVLDPFSGSGTTGLAAAELGRRYVGIDLNRDYLDMSLRTRLRQGSLTSEASA